MPTLLDVMRNVAFSVGLVFFFFFLVAFIQKCNWVLAQPISAEIFKSRVLSWLFFHPPLLPVAYLAEWN